MSALEVPILFFRVLYWGERVDEKAGDPLHDRATKPEGAKTLGGGGWGGWFLPTNPLVPLLHPRAIRFPRAEGGFPLNAPPSTPSILRKT